MTLPNFDLMLAVIAGLLIGASLVWPALAGRVRDLRETLAQQTGELVELRARAAQLHADLERERAVAGEKIAALEEARGVFADAFRALSAEALHRNNQAFLDLAKMTLEKHQETATGDLAKRQQAIGELVAPIRASLEKFEQQVQGVEKSRIDAYATLFEQVRALRDGQGQLRKETANLVRALRAPHAAEHDLRRTCRDCFRPRRDRPRVGSVSRHGRATRRRAGRGDGRLVHGRLGPTNRDARLVLRTRVRRAV